MSRLVSVIMSTYNESINELELAINSILEQSYKRFELLIALDNPSNTELLDYLRDVERQDKRVLVFVNDSNIGLANSLNRLLLCAKGDYIARMDADDISYKERLEKQVAFLDNNTSYQVVATDRINIDEDGKQIQTKHIVVNNKSDFNSAMMYSNIITHPTVMMSKQLIISLGGYRDFKAAQDYDLWLRAIKCKTNFYTIPEVLLKYRIRGNSISNQNVIKQHSYMMFAQYMFKEPDVLDEELEAKFIWFLKKNRIYKPEDREKYNQAYRLLFDNNKHSMKLISLVKAALKHKLIIRYYLLSRNRDKIIDKYSYFS